MKGRLTQPAMPIEECLVRYAAPTLAACKVANLISLPCCIAKPKELKQCQSCLSRSGIEIHLFQERHGRRLIYVYRRSALGKVLQESEIQNFLSDFGYVDFSPEAALAELSRRFSEMTDAPASFPHEIGIFLGYPLADVRAFIVHQGKDARLTGDWKVYDNEEEALQTFSLYASCREKLSALFRQGHSLSELSVCG